MDGVERVVWKEYPFKIEDGKVVITGPAVEPARRRVVAGRRTQPTLPPPPPTQNFEFKF